MDSEITTDEVAIAVGAYLAGMAIDKYTWEAGVIAGRYAAKAAAGILTREAAITVGTVVGLTVRHTIIPFLIYEAAAYVARHVTEEDIAPMEFAPPAGPMIPTSMCQMWDMTAQQIGSPDMAEIFGMRAASLGQPQSFLTWEVVPTPESSFISEIAYSQSDSTLRVTITGQGSYTYGGVSSDTWSSFKTASSKGRFFDKNIKGKY